jgi:regulatory subunit for Cdc7p protein kinase
MATISLSPKPVPIATMSSRRVPLSSNPNVANSPMRASTALTGLVKPKRSYATVQREEPYSQAPPTKKQALENGGQRAVRSPSKIPRTQVLAQRASTTRTSARSSRSLTTKNGHDVDSEKEVWKKHHRAKFPKMVFYFDSMTDEIKARLTKRVTHLGARQEPFFSIDVTHVITTRSIPPERLEPESIDEMEDEDHNSGEQPQTINPSLLERTSNTRRKLVYDFQQGPIRSQLDDVAKRTRGTRNNDVLHKARDMGKKVWSLDKFHNMLNVLLEVDTHSTHTSRATSTRATYDGSKQHQEPNLRQLLQHERLNGPSDRDPSAVNRDLVYFKGPHIYIYDMDEKQKPIMVREYPKVANKTDGEWPQFRSVGNGRCPFVEEPDVPDKSQRRAREEAKAKAAKRDEAVPVLRPPEAPAPKPVTGKRTLTEMEDGHNRSRTVTPTDVLNPAQAVMSKQTAQQVAFTSRAEGGRLFAGEPVASGVQPSNITSAIRSQMISSTSGINGAKAGTSKEVHGLQRKVLQKVAPASHEASSRRPHEVSMDVASSRSISMCRQTSKVAQTMDDGSQKTTDGKDKRSTSQTLKSKRDLKPGYCENCQDKFRDFDEHILSRKHRKFAENTDNWVELDQLLSQLKRMPRYTTAASDEEEEAW